MEVRRYAGVIALDGPNVALVLEHRERWGGAFWTLPSGLVEAHETPEQGAARELREEAGLVVSPGELRLVSTSVATGEGQRSLAWNFVTQVQGRGLEPADPDGHVREARWFAVEEAAELLGRLPYRPIRDPVVAHLAGTAAAGSHWSYATRDSDPVVTTR